MPFSAMARSSTMVESRCAKVLDRIADGNGATQGKIGELWRMNILNELKVRLKKMSFDSSIVYEKAIEK